MKIRPIELHAMARPVLESGRAFIFKSAGSSMFPFIKDGQEVALRRKSQYSPGDIVLAITYPERETVMHYVVKDCGDCLLLMGAANLVKYERCRKDDVTGYLHSPHVSRNRIMLWHRLLPLRRYLLWIMRIGIRRE